MLGNSIQYWMNCVCRWQKTPLLKANTMFMAIPLEDGYHTIELRYFTPGLKAGIILTFSSIFIIAFHILFQRHRKKYFQKFSH